MRGLLGNFQYRGGFLHAHPTEESQLDDTGLARVDRHQRLKGIVYGNQVCAGLIRRDERFVQIQGALRP